MKKVTLILALFSLFTVLGCSSKVEMVDLDKVLDIMLDTLDSLANRSVGDVVVDQSAISVNAIAPENQNPEYDQLFLSTFENNLNAAKLISDPIVPAIKADGTITGTNSVTGKELFTVEMDAEQNRFIATDTQNSYHRDRGFPVGGMFMGYMMGSMLGRQRAAGVPSSRYSNMKMDKKGYFNSAKSSGSGARSKSGSSSFKSGK